MEIDAFTRLDRRQQKLAVESMLDRFLQRLDDEARQPDANEAQLFGLVCTCLCNGMLDAAYENAGHFFRPGGAGFATRFAAVALATPETRGDLRERLNYTMAHPGRP